MPGISGHFHLIIYREVFISFRLALNVSNSSMKNLGYCLLMLFSILAGAQEYPLYNDIRVLVHKTVDFEQIEVMRKLSITDIFEIEKEGYLKDYDSIADIYCNEFEYFYSKEYTHNEIKAFLQFCSSPTGSKLAKNLQQLYQGRFPEPELLSNGINIIMGKYASKGGIGIADHNKPLQNIIAINDLSLQMPSPQVDIIITKTGVEEYLEVIKEYRAMWVQPQFENDFRKNLINLNLYILKR
jgi:hypothetical protein